MTTNQKVTVTVWSESHKPVVTEKRTHRRSWPPSVIGLAGTLILHTIVLQSALLASQAHLARPLEEQAPGLTLKKTASKPVESLVFFDLPKLAKSDNDLFETLASIRAAIKETPIRVIRPDPSPPLEIGILALDEEESESSVNGDGAERARLFGIYSEQIQARIERVWRRPRTPVNDVSEPKKATSTVEYFRCQAQVVQDSIGNVQEILLPNCNGSVAWQRSLVLAIQQASPLPAPPSPTVFSNAVTLSFLGYAYIAGGSDEGYEARSEAIARAPVAVPTTHAMSPAD